MRTLILLRALADPDHLPALDRRYLLDRPALGHTAQVVDRYSERKEAGRAIDRATHLSGIATKNKV